MAITEHPFGLRMHPIQVAARRSGLTPDVIRAWERRYGAVSPLRSGTNRRFYTDEDVDRLLFLAKVTRAGRRIGDVAGLALEELRALAQDDLRAETLRGPDAATGSRNAPARPHLEACLEAVRRLDAAGLERALASASVALSMPVLMERVLLPMMTTVGQEWRGGSMRVAHEHLATSVVRSFLGALRAASNAGEPGPEIVVATPAGQLHEIGALMVAAVAAAEGWTVTYLGPDLPAAEIAAAARKREAAAVAVSIVYPADDPRLRRDLAALGGWLEGEVALIAGGPSAAAYSDVLESIDARVVSCIAGLRAELESLRETRSRN